MGAIDDIVAQLIGPRPDGMGSMVAPVQAAPPSDPPMGQYSQGAAGAPASDSLAMGVDPSTSNPISKVVGGALANLATLPQRAIDGSAADLATMGSGEPMQSVGPAVDTALLMTGGAGVVPAEANALRMGIKAYHGSPHSFDAFDTAKIGTGEGAQAYGHGLYFADNEGVAKSYRDALSRNQDGWVNTAKRLIKDKTGAEVDDDAARSFLSATAQHEDDPGRAAKVATWGAPPLRGLDMSKLTEAAAAIKGEKPGSMYEVNINADPEQFLDWDKPLSEQPQAVQDLYNAQVAPGLKTREVGVNPSLGPLTDVIHPQGGSLGVFTKDKLSDVLANPAKYTPTRGSDLYHDLTNQNFKYPLDDHPNSLPDLQTRATASLNQAGIPGIKYLDANSRAAGDGSRNYVVFDHNLVDIARKYGMGSIAALPPAALLATQGGDPEQ